jgi:hypothetical protein
VLLLLSRVGYFVAPGLDRVGAGLYKLAADKDERVCALLTAFFNFCLRLRAVPAIGRQSVIVPILKHGKSDFVLANLRPISLQSSLVKLLTKGLADRLVQIFARHPVLHPAQHGFILGGNSSHCVDVCVDVWETARHEKRGCYNLFYDVRAAYDTVRHPLLLLALRRLCLPESFVELVGDSLTGLTSQVRTLFGNTGEFAVQRSVQGAAPLRLPARPLALWLESNPLFDGKRDGFPLDPQQPDSRSVRVASEGFADDTYALSDTYEGVCRMHRWSEEFTSFNFLELHSDKSKFVGCDSDRRACDNKHMSIGGRLLRSCALDEGIDYVGVEVNMDLNWTRLNNKLTSHIAYARTWPGNQLLPDERFFFLQQVPHPLLEYSLLPALRPADRLLLSTGTSC